jgi:hypothetical protein
MFKLGELASGMALGHIKIYLFLVLFIFLWCTEISEMNEEKELKKKKTPPKKKNNTKNLVGCDKIMDDEKLWNSDERVLHHR